MLLGIIRKEGNHMLVQEMLQQMPTLAPNELELVVDEGRRLQKEAWEQEILAEEKEALELLRAGKLPGGTAEEVIAYLNSLPDEE